jgi:serine/threonine protein kinase
MLSEGSSGEEIAGTPAYMSPEQFRTERVDGRSDLYSLGATFYALLSGRPPFRRSATTTLTKRVLEEPAPSIRKEHPDVPRGVDHLISKLLQKAPADRYQTAREVAVVIDNIFAEREILSSTKRMSAIAITRDRTWWPWALAATATLVISVCVYASLELAESGSGQALAANGVAPDSELSDGAGSQSLEIGVQSFKTALESGRMNDLLQLFEPRQQSNPVLLNSLISLVQVTNSLPAGSRTSHAIISGTDGEANVVVLFGKPDDSPSLRVPLRWTKSRSGLWLLSPDASFGLRFDMRS